MPSDGKMRLGLTNLKKRLREGFKKSGYPCESVYKLISLKFTTFLFDLVKKLGFLKRFETLRMQDLGSNFLKKIIGGVCPPPPLGSDQFVCLITQNYLGQIV
jgi:hypothetical protein